jgi:hypothetical protein
MSMQHHTISRPPTPKPIAIEVDGEPLGIVVPSDDGYRFLAVRFSAFALDGRTFETLEAARSAVGAAVQADQPA